MSDTEGARPFDPYRTLLLHPAAPRDLVEKVYWLLASSVRSSAVSGSRIEELNAAYAMLVDDGARRSYDEAHGVLRGLAAEAAPSRSPRLRLFSAKEQKPGVANDDYYHVLRIDSEADSRIIQLAYDFWTHGVHGAPVERERIEQAHRTLSSPQLRAQYDARRGESAGPQTVEITKQIREQLPIVRHNGGEGAPVAPIPVAAAAETDASGETPGLDQVASAAPRSPGGRRLEAVAAAVVAVATDATPAAPEPPAEPAAPRHEARPAAAASGADARPAPLPDARAHPPAPAAVVAVVADATPAAPELPAEPAAPQHEARPAAAAGADARPAPLPDARARPPAPATRLLAGRELAEAQQNRLLQLREDAVTPDGPKPAFSPAAAEQEAAAATLAFIDGPRAGERIQLAGEVVTLGSGDGCEIVLKDATANIDRDHAHLMRRGATYMFRDLAGHDTTIADRPLTLPVVMLEDGDEIQIGAHRMRFATEG